MSDTGIGIKKEKLESIFEPFVQLQQRRTEGTGLGLAISRDLARGMGGDLSVTSEPAVDVILSVAKDLLLLFEHENCRSFAFGSG